VVRVKASRTFRQGVLGTAVAGMLATGSSAAWAAAVPRSAAAGSAATMIVQTVPAVRGVAVSLDGLTYRTGASGSVAIPTTSGWHHIRIQRPASLPANTSVRFVRWLDGIALASREIAIPPGTHVEQAGFAISRPIAFRFSDKNGHPVPLSEVGQVTLTNGLGQRFTFPPARPPRTFAVDRVVRDTSGLHTLPIRYSVRSVLIDGSDVVFGGSQNFYVSQQQRPWTVKVLLFPLKVKVRDALFRFPIGDALRLTLPNGSHRDVHLGKGHDALAAGLPRGTYELVAEGPGFGLSAPATLSGPQTDTLLMLSWIDLLVIAVFVAAFLVGLPMAGGRIAREPGRRRRLAWQTGPVERPLTTPARASAVGEEATAATLHELADAGTGTGSDTGVLQVTEVMPVGWDVTTTSAAPARGRRRRQR
jgi:hypothetical protein